jgi:hypothetical protein
MKSGFRPLVGCHITAITQNTGAGRFWSLGQISSLAQP